MTIKELNKKFGALNKYYTESNTKELVDYNFEVDMLDEEHRKKDQVNTRFSYDPTTKKPSQVDATSMGAKSYQKAMLEALKPSESELKKLKDQQLSNFLLGPSTFADLSKKPEKQSIFELKRQESPVKSILGRKRNHRENEFDDHKSNLDVRQSSVTFSHNNFLQGGERDIQNEHSAQKRQNAPESPVHQNA